MKMDTLYMCTNCEKLFTKDFMILVKTKEDYFEDRRYMCMTCAEKLRGRFDPVRGVERKRK
jgi:hypothetical protein